MAEIEEREIQKSYWIEHSVDLSVEAMMLDSKAADLDKEERPEVLSLLPDFKQKYVLELGAGIGRFTTEIAKDAASLIAVDFIESVIKKNASANGHFKNTKFMCADVTSPGLQFAPESFDLIFSNWLLMYLSDAEVESLARRLIGWVKVGGYVFFRESCFHQSGDSKRKTNPTHYREPRFYTKVFKECHWYDGAGSSFEFLLLTCKCIGAYVRNKKNQNQICWMWQKVRSTEDKYFQRFLDNVQYNSNGILRYERVFGEGFVSTGGIGQTHFKVPLLAFYHAIGRQNLQQDKPALFRSFFNWLKPGGKVLISDYCKSAREPSPEFSEYIKQRGYDLHDIAAYGQMLKDVGFVEVIAEDRTDQFLKVLQNELDAVEKEKGAFIHDFSLEDYNDIVEGWKKKLVRSSSGEQRWGLFIAKK